MSVDQFRIQVAPTFVDFATVSIAAFHHNGGWKVAAFVGFLVAAMAFFAGLAAQRLDVLIHSAAIGFSAGAFAYVVLLALPIVQSRNAARYARAGVAYTFTELGIQVAGRGFAGWGEWSSAVETRHHFVLAAKRGALHIFPKRTLTADEAMRLRIALNDFLAGPPTVFVEQRA